MALRAQKELEAKLHDQLYGNIYLLTLIYPPSDDFLKVFKKDMFVKSNKAASHQVIYYLLEVLDPVKLKQKVVSWPIFDMRIESQFRNEVMKYINELNSLYQDANLPTVMTSHLISPSGYKFVKFMLKLSQLVMYEHLQKSSPIDVLCRIRPNKVSEVTENTIKRLNCKTQTIDQTLNKMKSDFESKVKEYQDKANEIVQKQLRINEELPMLQEKYNTLLQSNVAADDLHLNTDEINGRMQLLRDKIAIVQNFYCKFKTIYDMITFINSNALWLDYNNLMSKSPEEELDILHLLEEFNVLMSSKCFEFKSLSSDDLTRNIQKYSEVNKELVRLADKFGGVRDKLGKLLLNVNKENFNMVRRPVQRYNPLNVLQNITECDSTILAVRLEDSSLNNK